MHPSIKCGATHLCTEAMTIQCSRRNSRCWNFCNRPEKWNFPARSKEAYNFIVNFVADYYFFLMKATWHKIFLNASEGLQAFCYPWKRKTKKIKDPLVYWLFCIFLIQKCMLFLGNIQWKLLVLINWLKFCA